MRLIGRFLGVPWAVVGVSALLLRAIIGLSPRAREAIESGLSTWQWIALVGFALFMLVAEGYRGFQKKFSPRTAARVKYLRDHPTLLRVLLAPIFSMGFFHANRKNQANRLHPDHRHHHPCCYRHLFSAPIPGAASSTLALSSASAGVWFPSGSSPSRR